MWQPKGGGAGAALCLGTSTEPWAVSSSRRDSTECIYNLCIQTHTAGNTGNRDQQREHSHSTKSLILLAPVAEQHRGALVRMHRHTHLYPSLQQLGSGALSAPQLPLDPSLTSFMHPDIWALRPTAPKSSWWCRPSHTEVQLVGTPQVLCTPLRDTPAHRRPTPQAAAPPIPEVLWCWLHLGEFHAWPQGLGLLWDSPGKGPADKVSLPLKSLIQFPPVFVPPGSSGWSERLLMGWWLLECKRLAAGNSLDSHTVVPLSSSVSVQMSF